MQGHLDREADEAEAGLESGPGRRGQHGLRDERIVSFVVRKYFFRFFLFSILWEVFRKFQGMEKGTLD